MSISSVISARHAHWRVFFHRAGGFGAYPYRNLSRIEYEQVLHMLSEGVETRRSRRGAYIHRDRVHGMLRARRGARLTAITNGGAIPDTADYDVVEFPSETTVGKVNEDFAIESLTGDIFLLGNRSWRIRRVGSGKVWVEDAQGLPPSIPFWLGESPGRTIELSKAVSDLRRDVADRISDRVEAQRWLIDELIIPEAAAEQIAAYVAETQNMLGTVPGQQCIIAERFFDEAGGMQLVIHSPWGARINRAWGLALRKRFCVSFDRELQAAATDDGIVISLVEQHSFPLSDVFQMLRPAMIEPSLIQAALVSPMFTNRWRWNSTRALAVMRHSGGRKVPVALQRMRAEDLLAAVFPEQMVCGDNRTGPVELPEHPLVNETIRDCLHEAMDLEGVKKIIAAIESGAINTLAVDTPAPSPMAHEILNANPYAFLDDAPLEERRARAVSLRRIDPRLEREFGQLDQSAIDEVCRQAWPEIRNGDELHDFLLGVGILSVEERPDWRRIAEQLINNRRATEATWLPPGSQTPVRAYVAAERPELVRTCLPDVTLAPPVELPLVFEAQAVSEEEASKRIVQGWMEAIGPTTVTDLSNRLGIESRQGEAALLSLEGTGMVLRGRFTPSNGSDGEIEWCDRVLLARIPRLTPGRMRREIEPVSPVEFMSFLLSWQHVGANRQLEGRDGVLRVIQQLQGLELPAPAWEQWILPARVRNYSAADLEHLCLGGVVAWGRLRLEQSSDDNLQGKLPARRRRKRLAAPARNAPIAFLIREDLDYFLGHRSVHWADVPTLSSGARDVARYLEQRGASFVTDIARGAGLLKVKVEEALWELVAHGLATGDGIAGLRVLLLPEHKRQGKRHNLRVISGGRSAARMMPVGRWSLWSNHNGDADVNSEQFVERQARELLEK